MKQNTPCTIIREHKPADKQGLISCLEELCDYLIPLDPLKFIRRLPSFGKQYTESLLKKVKRNDGAICVAETSGTIMGIIVGTIVKPSKLDQLSFASKKYGRIQELYVDPAYRGKNVGRALVEKMEVHFKRHGCDHIRIEVFQPNTSAHAFYQALGYTDRVIDVIKEIKD